MAHDAGPAGQPAGGPRAGRPPTRHRPSRLAYRLLAAGMALLAAYVDRHDGDVTELLAFVAVGAGLLGYLRPARPWRWGLLLGLVVPATEAAARLLHQTGRAAPDPGGAIVALVPAVLGAYAGALLGRALTPPPPREPDRSPR